MMVATLLTATSVWAKGDVTVIKQLNGTANDNAGTVEYKVGADTGNCSLVVTPAEGNFVTVEYITAERIIDAGFAQAPRRRTPDINDMINVTADMPDNDPSQTTTYTFAMPNGDYDVEVTVNFQSRTSISDAVITLAQSSFTYDGTEKQPAVKSVVLGGSALTTADYAVSYSDNVNVGRATVTVTGQRTYMGEATANFTINKADLTLRLTMNGWTYGQQASDPVLAGNEGRGTVTYSYKVKTAGDDTYEATKPTDAGSYTVKAEVAETDNYNAGSTTADFTIAKADLELSLLMESWTYGDAANTPVLSGNLGNGEVTISFRGENEDLFSETVPTQAGSYVIKAEVAETANYNSGETESEFSIAQASLGDVTIAPIDDQDYTGEAIEPAITVTFKGQEVSAEEYSVRYSNNIDLGVATVMLTSNNINFYEPDIMKTQTFNIVGTELDMNGHEWITYLAAENLTIPEGLKAYVVNNVKGQSVIASETTYIPQGVAVLIGVFGEFQDKYIATTWRGEETTYESMLQGSTSDLDVTTLTTENDIYVLYNNEFVKTTRGTIPAGRCYLPINKALNAGARLTIGFDEEATGIRAKHADAAAAETVAYNLNGQRVAASGKGLYIVNGKKVVIK